MKPPEEIKCGMECIRTNASRICIKPKNGQCQRCEQLVSESLVRIQQLESDNESKQKRIEELESQLAQVERERDAAVFDIAVCKLCRTCEEDATTSDYGSARCHACFDKSKWQWRGVCAENTEDKE